MSLVTKKKTNGLVFLKRITHFSLIKSLAGVNCRNRKFQQMCNKFCFSTENLQGKKLNVQDNMKTCQYINYIINNGLVLYPEKKKGSFCRLCILWGPRRGPAPGVAEWQGLVITAFLGEVDLSFCFVYFPFGNYPTKKGATEGVKGWPRWLRSISSQNRGVRGSFSLSSSGRPSMWMWLHEAVSGAADGTQLRAALHVILF